MDLSIVIVSWNCCYELVSCLQSIFVGMEDLEFEVIVVDNASSDGTIAKISQEFKQATIIANNQNIGFPKANNIGIKVSKGEFVLLLNPDTILTKGVLKICVDKMRRMPQVGALGCRLIYPDGKPQYESGRRFLNLWDLLTQSFYLHTLFPKSSLFNRHLIGDWDHADEREIDCISGAFMLLRRKALEQVGYLSEKVFMYYEDIEMCFRLKQQGWKIWFLGTVTVIHLAGQSSAKSQQPLWLLEGDIKCRLMKLLYGDLAVLTCRVIIIIRSVFRLVVGLLLYIPAWLLGKLDFEPNLFKPYRNLQMLRWSVKPSSIHKYFPQLGS